MIHVCKYCKEEFDHKSYNKKYCSTRCRYDMRKAPMQVMSSYEVSKIIMGYRTNDVIHVNNEWFFSTNIRDWIGKR